MTTDKPLDLVRKARTTGIHPGGMVDATMTKARIQALMAMGWRRSDIASNIIVYHGHPISVDTLDQYRQSISVRTRTERSVRAAYQTLTARGRGPSRSGATKAQRRGYSPLPMELS